MNIDQGLDLGAERRVAVRELDGSFYSGPLARHRVGKRIHDFYPSVCALRLVRFSVASLWANSLARSCHQSASGRLPLLAWCRDVSRQLAIQRSMIDSGIMTYLMFGSRSLSL
jgi:hypothetical protein